MPKKKERFNFYTVLQDILAGKEGEVSSGNLYEALGLKEKKPKATTEENDMPIPAIAAIVSALASSGAAAGAVGASGAGAGAVAGGATASGATVASGGAAGALNLDTVTLNLTKAIEAQKVDTSNMDAQFENVSGATDLAHQAAVDKFNMKKKEEAEVMQLADQARRNPGAIGMTFAGPDATGANRLEGLTPSRITSRGKGRGGRL